MLWPRIRHCVRGRLPPTRVSPVIGTAFLKAGNHLALEVPSVIVPFESNYLLNPDHPTAATLEPVEEIPVGWDGRFGMWKKPIWARNWIAGKVFVQCYDARDPDFMQEDLCH